VCPAVTTPPTTVTPPTTAAPPATTVPTTVAPPATTTPITVPPTLARTGANVIAVATTGIVVALAGGLLLGYASRRWPVAFYGW